MSDSPSKPTTVEAWLNPFHLFYQEANSQSGPIETDRLLDFFGYAGEDSRKELALRRYKEIEPSVKSLIVIPADSRIGEKLVTPIRQAIGSHMMGGFLGSVALCGFAAEMLAILLWELADVQINSNPLNDNVEEDLLGRRFEKLGQERRISVLKAYGVIKERDIRELTEIKNTRNKYLHLWSNDHATLESDSKASIARIVSLLHLPFPQKIVNGSVEISGALTKYLQRSGSYEAGKAS